METKDALNGITTWRERIHAEDMWGDPNRLSETMARLATYNAYLTDKIALLHKTASETEILAFKRMRDNGATAKDAELGAKQEALEARYEYENIKLVAKATESLISVLQSRLKILGRNDV